MEAGGVAGPVIGVEGVSTVVMNLMVVYRKWHYVSHSKGSTIWNGLQGDSCTEWTGWHSCGLLEDFAFNPSDPKLPAQLQHQPQWSAAVLHTTRRCISTFTPMLQGVHQLTPWQHRQHSRPTPGPVQHNACTPFCC